ncbi:unannotated protein [freshwater metagenome]|uniref:Unannotated protein n=1 Tax=freshwater metagenome TaxID=449393 RepID=A0A6J7L652_9ZZZZ
MRSSYRAGRLHKQALEARVNGGLVTATILTGGAQT